jgi:hypothetical protein
MPTCIADKKFSEPLCKRNAIIAPLLPFDFRPSSRDDFDDTTAISDKAKKPLSKIRIVRTINSIFLKLFFSIEKFIDANIQTFVKIKKVAGKTPATFLYRFI